jgi:hypothetical protein
VPFVIYKAERPMVRVTPLDAGDATAAPLRRLGLLAGQCQVPDDFDQMAASEIADLFEGWGCPGSMDRSLSRLPNRE